MSINKKELQAYEDRLREQMTYETRMACAVQEALEQGMEKGREEGIMQGMEQGRKRAKIELAQKLLAKGFSIEDVAEATELAIEEVKSLQ